MLVENAAQFGLALNEAEANALELYARLLMEAKDHQNLTGYDSIQEIHRHLVLDALAAYTWLPREGSESVIDLGTGAGIPGLALAVTSPMRSFTLVDARERKIAFVKDTAQQMGLNNVTSLASRAEDAGRAREHREMYDIALAKGLAELRVLVELAVPLLSTGGVLLAWKGPAAEEEIRGAANALSTLHAQVVEVHDYVLPGTIQDRRCLIIIRRVGALPKTYPRRAGVPERRPL